MPYGSSVRLGTNLYSPYMGAMQQAAATSPFAAFQQKQGGGAGGGGSVLYNSNPEFTLNPKPQEGSGPYGSVPGPLGLPNPYADLKKVMPSLPSANAALGDAILSKLKGELSPATIANIQDAAARFGVASGMPGSGLAVNRNLRDLGLATEAQIASGINAYNQSIPTISGTQTVSPALQAQIAEINSINAAAPNPAQAAGVAQGLFANYLAKMRGPGGGTGGYSGPGSGGWMPVIRPLQSNVTPAPADAGFDFWAAQKAPGWNSGLPPQQASNVAGVAGNLLGGYF